MRNRTPVLLLFGAFAVGYNLAVVLHEFGHLLASWGTGDGSLHTWKVLIHPFSVSYVWQNNSDGLSPAVTATILAGGIVVGMLVPLLLLPLTRRLQPGGAPRLVLLMTAANAMMLGGLYLVTALVVPWGDAGQLLDLGTPPWALAAAGVPLMIAWVLLYAAVVRDVGLASGMTIGRSLQPAVLGISIYPLLIVLYQVFLAGEPQVPLDIFVAYAIAVVLCMVLAVPLARRLQRRSRFARTVRISRQAVPGLLWTGAVMVSLPLWIGEFRYERQAPNTVSNLCPSLIAMLGPWTAAPASDDTMLRDLGFETPALSGYCRFHPERADLPERWNFTVEAWRYADTADAVARFDGFPLGGAQVVPDAPFLADATRLARTVASWDDSSLVSVEWLAVVRSGSALLAFRAETLRSEAFDSMRTVADDTVLDLAVRLVPAANE